MNRILIYGPPGVGKTTAGQLLHAKLNLELIEGDYLREAVAQKEHTAQDEPFVYVGTKEAWQLFGDMTKANVVKGLLAVRKAMEPYISDVIESKEDMIFEVAFLDPNLYMQNTKLVLMVTPDEAQHQKQFLEHRPKDPTILKSFEAVRMIQNFLIKEAQGLPVTIVHNKPNKTELLDQFISSGILK